MINNLPKLRLSNFLIAVAALTFITACTSGPQIFINEDPNADFSSFSTYNYESILGTDSDKGYRSVFSNYLITAMDKQMQARGYKKANDPDLTINFYVNSEEKISTTQQPTMGGGYYGYRGGYYGTYGGYETTVSQYTQGTVNVDLVNKKTATLVWEGVAVGKVTDKVRANLEEASGIIIADVMAKYTHYAAGYVPPVPPKSK